MKLKTAYLLSVLLLTACAGHPAAKKSAPVSGDWSLPYDKWDFIFYYPRGLDARPFVATVYDTAGNMYRFDSPDGTLMEDKDTVGGWNDRSRLFSDTYFTRSMYSQPPYMMLFCWDSFVDQKVYQTTVTFSPQLWQRMRTLSEHTSFRDNEKFWYKTLYIGLAPEGKVKIWLEEENNDFPNIPVIPEKTETISGKDTACQEVSDKILLENTGSTTWTYKFQVTDKLIKGKKYPYGNW